MLLRHVGNQIAWAQWRDVTASQIHEFRVLEIENLSETTRPSVITQTTGIAIGTGITPTLITTACLSLSTASGGDSTPGITIPIPATAIRTITGITRPATPVIPMTTTTPVIPTATITTTHTAMMISRGIPVQASRQQMQR